MSDRHQRILERLLKPNISWQAACRLSGILEEEACPVGVVLHPQHPGGVFVAIPQWNRGSGGVRLSELPTEPEQRPAAGTRPMPQDQQRGVRDNSLFAA